MVCLCVCVRLKISCILLSTCCPEGYTGIIPNDKYMKFINVIIYRGAIALGVSET